MGPLDKVTVGMAAEKKVTVTQEMTVYGTPMMILHMEMASGSVIASSLPAGYISVGMAVDIRHLAARRSAAPFVLLRGSPGSRRRASYSSGARPVLIAQMPPLMLRRHAPVNCQRPRSESPGWSEGRGPERSQWYLRSDSLIGRSLIEARRRCISPLGANSQFSLP